MRLTKTLATTETQRTRRREKVRRWEREKVGRVRIPGLTHRRQDAEKELSPQIHTEGHGFDSVIASDSAAIPPSDEGRVPSDEPETTKGTEDTKGNR